MVLQFKHAAFPRESLIWLSVTFTNDADLILSNQVLAIDPRMVLHEEFGTIFTLAEEDFLAARVDLSVLSDIVDATLVNRPAVILFIVLLNLL